MARIQHLLAHIAVLIVALAAAKQDPARSR